MGLFFSIINPNYRQPSEDELADYAEQAREERYEREIKRTEEEGEEE